MVKDHENAEEHQTGETNDKQLLDAFDKGGIDANDESHNNRRDEGDGET